MRVQVILECTETKLRHYVTTKNKKNSSWKIRVKKIQSSVKRYSLYRS